MRGLALVVGVLLLVRYCYAQDPQPSSHLLIETNAPSAVLWLDGRPLGRAASGPFVVPPGPLHLRLVDADPDVWRPRSAEVRVTAAEGDTLALRLDLPHRYRIESIPFGAAVRVEGGAELGVTPLVVETEGALPGALVVEAPGYAPARRAVGEEGDVSWLVRLVPLYGDPPPSAVPVVRPEGRFGWADGAALGVALAAAAVSIHFKTEADRRYDAYLETRDPALRAGARTHDRYAAAALGVSAVGFGTFAVRLALR